MIVFRPLFGLANRMRAIASAWHLSLRCKQRLIVAWCVDSDLGAPYHTLFQPLPCVVYNFRRRGICDRLFNRILSFPNVGVGPSELEQLKPHRDGGFEESELLGRLEGPVRFLASCNHFYRPPGYSLGLFRPVTTLEQLITSEYSKWNQRTVVGIHIRRTDHELARSQSPTEQFIVAMRKMSDAAPQLAFYLSTDDEQVKTQLQSEFGDRLFTRSVPLSRSSAAGMQEAVIDLFLLARTSKIIGSHASSFSAVAAAIGGTSLEYP